MMHSAFGVELCLLDTVSSESSRDQRIKAAEHADFIIFVYDLTDESPAEKVQPFIDEVARIGAPKYCFLHKADLSDRPLEVPFKSFRTSKTDPVSLVMAFKKMIFPPEPDSDFPF